MGEVQSGIPIGIKNAQAPVCWRVLQCAFVPNYWLHLRRKRNCLPTAEQKQVLADIVVDSLISGLGNAAAPYCYCIFFPPPLREGRCRFVFWPRNFLWISFPDPPHRLAMPHVRGAWNGRRVATVRWASCWPRALFGPAIACRVRYCDGDVPEAWRGPVRPKNLHTTAYALGFCSSDGPRTEKRGISGSGRRRLCSSRARAAPPCCIQQTSDALHLGRDIHELSRLSPMCPRRCYIINIVYII